MRLFLQKKHKRILSFFAILIFFFSGALPTFALFGGLKIPTPSNIASDIEKRYHIDLENIQDTGEIFNVAQNKQPAPQVSLFFSPSDPRPGEKISAQAFPTYFITTPENLYYTWYLKRQGCDLSNSPSSANRTACDRNGDGRITVEDWKVEAMRILAQNGYDSTETNYSAAADSDGYRAPFGGNNQTNNAHYCYINDARTGVNYEIADSGEISFSCPSGTSPVCMIPDQGFEPSTIPGNTAGNSDDGETFTVSDTGECAISGLPACGSDGNPVCGVGTPRCVADPQNDATLSADRRLLPVMLRLAVNRTRIAATCFPVLLVRPRATDHSARPKSVSGGPTPMTMTPQTTAIRMRPTWQVSDNRFLLGITIPVIKSASQSRELP
ncbi:MAG: hypothetical protein WDN67_02690 [Candidatus Moraniibacteriota bacterium]